MQTPKMRTPVSRSRRGPSRHLNNSFKSPVRSPAPLPPADQESVVNDVETMRNREAELDKEIAQLQEQGHQESDLSQYIRLLHRYNEMKDVGQMLLGRIATLEGVTTREMYSKFGLDPED